MVSSNVIMGILRHILTIVGGYLAAKFAINANMLDAGISAIVALVGISWSIVSKTPYDASASELVLPAPATPTSPAMGLLGVPRASYGTRKDGQPRKRPGRKPKNKK